MDIHYTAQERQPWISGKAEQAPLPLFAPVTWKQGTSGLVDLYLANFRAFNSCVLSKCLGRRKRKVNQEKRKYGPQYVEGVRGRRGKD